jgi:threonine dehydratase
MVHLPTYQEMLDAAKRLEGKVLRTPLIYSDVLSRKCGVKVYLKPECLQPGGVFKLRGATNTIAMLTEEERQRGVVTASSGNHGTAVALAAARAGIKATIVLPANAPEVKVQRIKNAGAEIVRWGEHYGDSEEKAYEMAGQGYTLVHPFDDPRVVAGQGTIGLEIAVDAPKDLGAVLVPVGGGGLISGIALALKYTRPKVEIIGIEPVNAPSLTEALKAGRPVAIEPKPTCADGLSPRYTGKISLEVAQERIKDVVLLTEEELMEGSKFCLEELKLVVEPSGAAGVSALIFNKIKLKSGSLTVVLSGSNMDKKYYKEILGL